MVKYRLELNEKDTKHLFALLLGSGMSCAEEQLDCVKDGCFIGYFAKCAAQDLDFAGKLLCSLEYIEVKKKTAPKKATKKVGRPKGSKNKAKAKRGPGRPKGSKNKVKKGKK